MQIAGYDFTKRMRDMLWDEVSPVDQPAFVRVLEYQNGAVVSKHLTRARDAMAFLEEKGSV